MEQTSQMELAKAWSTSREPLLLLLSWFARHRAMLLMRQCPIQCMPSIGADLLRIVCHCCCCCRYFEYYMLNMPTEFADGYRTWVNVAMSSSVSSLLE
jgi:hypothetical protein